MDLDQEFIKKLTSDLEALRHPTRDICITQIRNDKYLDIEFKNGHSLSILLSNFRYDEILISKDVHKAFVAYIVDKEENNESNLH